MSSDNHSFEKYCRKLEDNATNVLRSDYKSFNPTLRIFINLLENDDFFSPIADRLRHPRIFDDWWATANASRGSMLGSGKLIIPEDEDERLILFYQIIKEIASEKISLSSFNIVFFSELQYENMAYRFNNTFFSPFLKLLEYKIEDIKEKMESDDTPFEPSFKYINIIDKSINIGVNNGIISTGDNTKNTINNCNELCDRLSELKKLEDVKDNPKAEKLVEDIVRLTEKNKDKISIVEKIGKLMKIISSTEAKLKEIASNFAIGIGSNVTVEAIKYLLR